MAPHVSSARLQSLANPKSLTVEVSYTSRDSHGFHHPSSLPHLRYYETTYGDFQYSLAHFMRHSALSYPTYFQYTFHLEATEPQVCLDLPNVAEASSLHSQHTSCMQITRGVTSWNKLPSLWRTSACEILHIFHVTSRHLGYRSTHLNMIHCLRKISELAVFSITSVNAAAAFGRA